MWSARSKAVCCTANWREWAPARCRIERRWGARQALALGPGVVAQIHQRLVAIACEHKIAPGRKLRTDTTVVETNIHYPTDSSLLGDGVRVLTRVIPRSVTPV